jgi:mycoredoxin
MPASIVMYGATYCEDTAAAREHLMKRGIPFHEVTIDHDPEAEQFVIFINGGNRTTPALMLGDGKRRILLTEPTNAELDDALAQVGLLI